MINTAIIKIPKPIIVDTWLGPKPPEVAKLEEVLNTKFSKLGVLKYKKLIKENIGNNAKKSNCFNSFLVVFLWLQYNAKTAKDIGPLKLKAMAFLIDSPRGTWVNAIPTDNSNMYIKNDTDTFAFIGPKINPKSENKINPYFPV